jgi:glycerol-3-phosphate cytidylyltransferase
LLHVGHINFLKRAKKLGDHLTVVVSSDDFNLTKGKSSVYCLIDRIEILESIKFIDEVMIETSWEQKIDDIIDNQLIFL